MKEPKYVAKVVDANETEVLRNCILVLVFIVILYFIAMGFLSSIENREEIVALKRQMIEFEVKIGHASNLASNAIYAAKNRRIMNVENAKIYAVDNGDIWVETEERKGGGGK